MQTIHIEQIRPELTWRLRQGVLYPDAKLYEMEMEEDNQGYHFGAFKGDVVVGVVSLFQNRTEFQFRKFAVDTDVQNMGIGKNLLNYIIDFAIAEDARRIWCNARITAIGFYQKFGFIQTGKCYSNIGIDYEVMEKIIQVESQIS